MDYSRIATALEEICSADRSKKAEVTACILSSLDEKHICPSVRLLMGELWPVWKLKEMRAGPQMIISALEGISSLDAKLLMEDLCEIGFAVERALERKTQRPLSSDPLSLEEVYCGLLKASDQSGEFSETRKRSILRGLFLRSSPLEAKYISRAVMRKMLTGLGPQTMILAIAEAFGADLCQARAAYSLNPDIGYLALAAFRGRLGEIRTMPSIPVRPMVIRSGLGIGQIISQRSLPGAFLFRHPGLRVQVHSLEEEAFVYTSRLRNITPSLACLSDAILETKHDFIAEANLVGFQKGSMITQEELIRYVNRRHCSRKVSIAPALLATDLLMLDGNDLTKRAYSKRREALENMLINRQPGSGFAISEARSISDPRALEELYRQSLSQGFGGLICRDLEEPYFPGAWSKRDFIIKEEVEVLNAAITAVQFGSGSRPRIQAKYKVALRDDEGLTEVGWVSSGLSERDAEALAKEVLKISSPGPDGRASVEPKLILRVKVAGARCNCGYSLIRPRIQEWARDTGIEEVSGIERLEEICSP